MHPISNLNTPSDENEPKQLGQLPSGTRLSRCVTIHAWLNPPPTNSVFVEFQAF